LAPEELEVAAVDECFASLDESDHGIPKRGCFPRIGCDAPLAVEGVGDVTVAGAIRAAIGGADLQAEAPTLLGGHAGLGRPRLSEPGARKARERVYPIEDVSIEGDERGELVGR